MSLSLAAINQQPKRAGYKNSVIMADITEQYEDTSIYGTETVTYRKVIEQHELNIEPGEFGYSTYAGKVFQSETVYRNGQIVGSCEYGANSDYARRRVAELTGK